MPNAVDLGQDKVVYFINQLDKCVANKIKPTMIIKKA